jgi:hypothetical protein
MTERTATLEELEERVKQLEPTPKRTGPGLDVRHVEALERIATSLEVLANTVRRDSYNMSYVFTKTENVGP